MHSSLLCICVLLYGDIEYGYCVYRWNLIGSYFHGTNWYASSMLTAVEPWTGHYSTKDEDLAVVYATAHVTQFTEVGWHYLPVGSGSGKLPNGGYLVRQLCHCIGKSQDDPFNWEFTYISANE